MLIFSDAVLFYGTLSMTSWYTSVPIGVREGILLGGRKKFALKITSCPKNKQFALILTFYFIRMGPQTLCKSVLCS